MTVQGLFLCKHGHLDIGFCPQHKWLKEQSHDAPWLLTLPLTLQVFAVFISSLVA